MEEIWVRNYIKYVDWNNKFNEPLYFSIINGKEIIIDQNNGWKDIKNQHLMAYLETDGRVQDRKLRPWEIVKLKLLGIL